MNGCTRRIAFAITLITVLVSLTACGHPLRGKVVQGPASTIEVVHEMDPRLQGHGIANVEVLVRRDPHRPGSQLVGRERTGSTGDFSMRIQEFGAGWMHEEWLVQARSHGFQNASSVMKLPSGRWRLLITLAPGTATPFDVHEEILEDLERWR
jgi:hypothetical protein